MEETNPSVRYFTLRWILERPEEDGDVIAAKEAIEVSFPVREILRKQRPDGYWGWNADGHRGTKGPLMLLLWLGFRGDGGVKRALEYRINGCLSKEGAYALRIKGKRILLPCHGAELLRQMLWCGYEKGPRTQKLLNWLVRSQLPSGAWNCISKAKPPPCQWATADILRAFRELPTHLQSPEVRQARDVAVHYFLESRLYQFGKGKPDPQWLQFGYPLQWDSDVLDVLESIAPYVTMDDPRIQDGLERVLVKQDEQGRWPCEKHPRGGKWIEDYIPLERIGRPSKWVTLHALRMLKTLAEDKPKASSA